MTGAQLHDLLQRKWGRSYDLQIFRRGERLYLQVMWRYLGQGSFALSEDQYEARLERISAYLSELGVQQQVVDFLMSTREKPRIGRAVSFALEVE
ncbi:DUF3067 family protein [Gloeobacter kilaueensis]|uniref:DUF3067 family protein n=1 Tax=Gloeobacter kilaueensis TaxID=1416614 RepID=UPI00059DE8D3